MMAGTAEEEMLWLQHSEHHHQLLRSGGGAAAAAARTSSGLHRRAAAWGGASQQTVMDGIVAGTVTLTTDPRKSSSRGTAFVAMSAGRGPTHNGLYGDGSTAATEATAGGAADGSPEITNTDTANADDNLNEGANEEVRLGSSSSSQLLITSRGGSNSSHREATRRDLSQQQQRPGTDLRALGSTLLKHLHAVSVHDLPKINGVM